MRKKSKKLSLKKEVIVNLENNKMINLKGGGTMTEIYNTCPTCRCQGPETIPTCYCPAH